MITIALLPALPAGAGQIATTVVSAALLMAGLFALYGLLRPRPQCGSQCSLCKSSCERAGGEHDD